MRFSLPSWAISLSSLFSADYGGAESSIGDRRL